MTSKRRLALLIDADNAQASLLPQIVDVVSQHGVMTTRRIYGNWSLPHLSAWQEILNVYALKSQHQVSCTPGKNATDIALVIDAMDILHTATDVDGFCIVSSDSDFTPLVIRIRETSRFAMGIGRSTTPSAFVEACDVFVFTETLNAASANGQNHAALPALPTNPAPAAASSNAPALEKVLRTAFSAAVQDDGWAHLGNLGHHIREIYQTFNYRLYGYTSLSQLVAAHPNLIETQMRKTPGDSESMYIRLKKTKGKQT
jgi:hypothetical protein